MNTQPTATKQTKEQAPIHLLRETLQTMAHRVFRIRQWLRQTETAHQKTKVASRLLPPDNY